MIQRDTATPPNQQLAAILRSQIESGELARGARLPAILTLAEQYKISPVTVRKALALLKDEGLVHGVSGYGTFVTDQSKN